MLRFRRYDLKRVDGRLMLVRNELDRAFEWALVEEYAADLRDIIKKLRRHLN
jgi:hypothetical protein